MLRLKKRNKKQKTKNEWMVKIYCKDSHTFHHIKNYLKDSFITIKEEFITRTIIAEVENEFKADKLEDKILEFDTLWKDIKIKDVEVKKI